MTKFNVRKFTMVSTLIAALGTIAVGFQNFTPHEPFKGHDGSDLHMNDALMNALKTSEKDKVERKLAMNRDSELIDDDLPRKKPQVLKIDTGMEVDTAESAREPANVEHIESPEE